MIDLRNLETFYAVAQLGGFHRAAERLHTTQPAVSARIAQLEQQLKGRLFERDKRGCFLTTKGRQLLGYAEQMISLNTEIVEVVAGRTALSGTVQLGASDTIVHTWLSELLKRLNREYPDITLEVNVDSTANLTTGLTDGSIDVALLMGPVSASNAENLPLCSYPISWVVSSDFPIESGNLSLEVLANYPIITFARSTRPYFQLKEMFGRAHLHNVRIFANSSLSSIVRMTLDDIGVAAIPKHVVSEHLASGRLRVVETEHEMPVMSFTATFIRRPDMPLNSIVAELAQNVAEKYGENVSESPALLVQ
ncbi:LysR family transcriptional regulator [Paraburkholderia sacchari]|uniref:LysR family transcriptional regulator n=1 Tax=Paraburkholderia sacchari TaxID=159450 RepID=UPI001BCD30C9|nr:LysR family transcriptional regulator [Paraburkholderia sacchari]